MAKQAAHKRTNFSGGVRRDRGLTELQKNELLDARNIVLGDRGKIVTRLGSHQIGQTLSDSITNMVFFQRSASTPTSAFLANNNATTASSKLYYLLSEPVYAAISVGDTSIDITNGSNYAASGDIEIDGDIISYTSRSGTTFSGVTGITKAHAVGAPANQWSTLSQTGGAMDMRRGVYYAVLNNILVINARGGGTNWKYIDNDDAKTLTAASTPPTALFVTNYRDRLYAAGELNPQHRVYFSARGDGVTWAAADYFDVEDGRGEPVTGFVVLNDRLGIFKSNSLFTYDEIELKKRLNYCGAYNQQVIRQIGGRVFTFSPNGIFETDLFSARQIGDPVRDYWEGFLPEWDTLSGTVRGRIVTNTFAAADERYYRLFIGNTTSPKTSNGVVLVYDTVSQVWTIDDTGFTNYTYLGGFEAFKHGGRTTQLRRAMFGGTSGGKVFRHIDDKTVSADTATAYKKVGDKIYQDNIVDTGTPIPAWFETIDDFDNPQYLKAPKVLRVLTEGGQWTVEMRVEDESGMMSAYFPLGTVSKHNEVLPIPRGTKGYRFGLKFSSVNTAGVSTFSGYVYEDIEVSQRF